MNTSLLHLSVQQLRHAAALRERIEALERQLAGILGGSVPAAAAPVKRRKMSAAGRARIAAAARARWARVRAAKGASGAQAAPKRKMSAAGRARLAALARARWKKVKAMGRSRL